MYCAVSLLKRSVLQPYKKLLMYKKPSYVAEFGITNEVCVYSICGLQFLILGQQDDDPLGVSLHNGLWAPLFSLGAGSCM